MRVSIAVPVFVAIAAFAIGKTHPDAAGHLRPGAGRIIQKSRRNFRQGMDLLGLCAYLAATNRGLPDRHVLQSAYRTPAGTVSVVPFWGGASEATAASGRTPEPAVVAHAQVVG